MQGKQLIMIDESSKKTIDLLSPETLDSAIISSGLTSLNSPNGIKQVKIIRSPTFNDLNLESNSSLVLSGNLGVKTFGSKTEVHSNHIRIYSRDSEILFSSLKGIKLPLIPYNSLSNTQSRLSRNTVETTSLLSLHQICICRNGRMFKIRKLDESESCSEAKFPVSANPCL